jgi:hypothetical protein
VSVDPLFSSAFQLKMRIKFVIIATLCLLARTAAAQPAVEVAPEQEKSQTEQEKSQTRQERSQTEQAKSQTELSRKTPIENPLGGGPATLDSSIGGYGELTLNAPLGNSPGSSVIDLRRLVLFVGHNFTENLRFYSEVEIEHAVSSAEDKGEIEIEQAYLDALLSRRFNLRGGLILVPVGIINVYHEPPTFNGVDRPEVDQFIVPTTWREPGIGIFGELTPTLHYQLYLMGGLNANGFTAEAAIREGHQEASLAHAGDVAVAARLDWEPHSGSVLGLSAYGGTSGNTLGNSVGNVPVGLFEIDSRTRRGGFEARAELAFLLIGDTAALNTALTPMPPETNPALPIPSFAIGGYAELGYDLFRLVAPDSAQTLRFFGRYDFVDTQADVQAPFSARPELRRHVVTMGLTYLPIPQIALKLDCRRHEFGEGPGFNEIASAITWMF